MANTFQCDKVLEQLVFVQWVCSDNFIELKEMGHLKKRRYNAWYTEYNAIIRSYSVVEVKDKTRTNYYRKFYYMRCKSKKLENMQCKRNEKVV